MMAGRHRQQGNIFVVSMGLLLMMVFLGIGLFYRIERDFQVEESGHEQSATFNAAETGVQIGLFWLEDRATNGNYPDVGTLDAVQVPSLVSGELLTIAQGGGCLGYSRFNSLNLGANSSMVNAPSSDLSTPVSVGLRLLGAAPSGISGCTLMTIPSDSTLGSTLKLSTTQFDFYVEALPTESAQAVGQQVGVSNVYGHSGQNVAYPYRIRAVGRHHPEAGSPFDSSSDSEARFDQQVILDMWVYYEV